MSDPRKTIILKAIAEHLDLLPDIQEVYRYKGKPVDLDLCRFPCIWIFDEGEERIRRNQINVGSMQVLTYLYYLLDATNNQAALDFSDQSDNFQALIHNHFFGQNNLTGIGLLKLEEVNVEKMYPNDIHGVLITRYTVEYGHVFGDAFKLPQDI